VLEATGWQTREVVDAMNATPADPDHAQVDGGMTSDNLLMQTVADVLNVPVVRAMVPRRCRWAPLRRRARRGLWPDLEGVRATGTGRAVAAPDGQQRRAAEYRNCSARWG